MRNQTSVGTVTLENALTGQRIVLREDPQILMWAKIMPGSDGVLTWDSQVVQYPSDGPVGLSYFSGTMSDGVPPVDCLLYRGNDGKLLGIANYYAVDYPPYERAGNYLILVDPEHRREGIARALLAEMDARWGVDFSQQKYSTKGLLAARQYLMTCGFKEVAA